MGIMSSYLAQHSADRFDVAAKLASLRISLLENILIYSYTFWKYPYLETSPQCITLLETSHLGISLLCLYTLWEHSNLKILLSYSCIIWEHPYLGTVPMCTYTLWEHIYHAHIFFWNIPTQNNPFVLNAVRIWPLLSSFLFKSWSVGIEHLTVVSSYPS